GVGVGTAQLEAPLEVDGGLSAARPLDGGGEKASAQPYLYLAVLPFGSLGQLFQLSQRPRQILPGFFERAPMPGRGGRLPVSQYRVGEALRLGEVPRDQRPIRIPLW